MGILWRTLAPRPVKKARRLLSPTQLIADAVQPRAVKKVRKVAYRTVNPMKGVEGLTGDAIMAAKRTGRKSSKGRAVPRSKQHETAIIVLFILGLLTFGYVGEKIGYLVLIMFLLFPLALLAERQRRRRAAFTREQQVIADFQKELTREEQVVADFQKDAIARWGAKRR